MLDIILTVMAAGFGVLTGLHLWLAVRHAGSNRGRG